MAVKIVKLVTGEELLTEVQEYSTDDGQPPTVVTLKQPMILIIQKDGLQMMPWLMLAAHPEVDININNIVTMYDARPELVTGYKQQTGGIVTAPATALDQDGKLVV